MMKAFDGFNGQVSVTNLRYVNDTTPIAKTSEELLELIKRVKAANEQFGL